jgi:hypothetical protein
MPLLSPKMTAPAERLAAVAILVVMDGDQPKQPQPDQVRDRHAYLEEQIARQKRGEPIDVDWVRRELEQVRREQVDKMASTQRNLRLIVIAAAVLLFVLWLKNGGLASPGGTAALGLVAIGLFAAIMFGRRRRQ